MNDICWRSPSNLALVKYWGKHGLQLPRNASISFTLSAAHTETRLRYQAKKDDGALAFDFYFHDAPKPSFRPKIEKLLWHFQADFPSLTAYHLEIRSSNSFPHSAGIASSASGMSALALCLCSLAEEVGAWKAEDQGAFLRKASYYARLGSGSACRSLYPELAVWGKTAAQEDSSDEYAVPFTEAHAVFKDFHDDILFISKSEKSVSSTAGHALMEGNPYAEARYATAEANMQRLLPALAAGDLETFGEIAEEEALSLHALMMSSRPGYVLMEPNSLKAIQRLRHWREETGHPLYFSLDAGPNLHLLYPHHIQKEVQAFVEAELRELCQAGQYLQDQVGRGPERCA